MTWILVLRFFFVFLDDGLTIDYDMNDTRSMVHFTCALLT